MAALSVKATGHQPPAPRTVSVAPATVKEGTGRVHCHQKVCPKFTRLELQGVAVAEVVLGGHREARDPGRHRLRTGDYKAKKSTVRIRAHHRSAVFHVNVVRDKVAEPTEVMYAVIDSASIDVATGAATGTILNDDGRAKAASRASAHLFGSAGGSSADGRTLPGKRVGTTRPACEPCRSSGDGHPAVDGEGLAGDVAGGVGGEEDHAWPRARPGRPCGRTGSGSLHQVEVARRGTARSSRTRRSPGAIALTRMPLRPVHCWARSRVSPIRPALDAEYAACGQAAGGEAEHRGDVDDRRPGLHHPAAGLGHPVAAVEVDVDDLRGTARASRGSPGTAVPMPALLTSTSTRPNSSIAASTSAVHASGSDDVGGDRRAPGGRRARTSVGGVREPVGAAGAEHDVGAGLGQALGERDAEAGGRAGHDRDRPSSRKRSREVMAAS